MAKEKNGARNNPPAVDPLTCAHERTEELKNGGQVCLNCGTKLPDKDTQQLADAIANAVVRRMKTGGGSAESKPPKKKSLTLRQKLGLDPKPGDEDYEEQDEQEQVDDKE